MKYLVGVVALAAFAMAATGCFNTPNPQTGEPMYPGPDEYAAYGYTSDPSFAAYDPFLHGYYWPVPYYPYWHSGGDGDRDCDDGFCRSRIGKQPPYLSLTVGSLMERLPLWGSAEVAPRTLSAESAKAAPSTPSTTINPGLSTVNNSHIFSAQSAGFGGRGFHSGGFGGGGFHGSFHR